MKTWKMTKLAPIATLALAAAADAPGFAAAPSPHELFGEAPDNGGHETVPLAEHGGYPTQGENYGRLRSPAPRWTATFTTATPSAN